MASTRRINNPADYQIEQLSNNNNINYLTTKDYGIPKGTYLPGNGLLQGKVAGENISSNSTDIESSLFGIGSTNLVEPTPDVVPNIYPVRSLNICDRKNIIIPRPLVIDSNQRPNEL